ncbi:lysophospholipid acyltransferase family protein [Polymorphum gilvum]|uniref:lysophospholipid acyltransferase family protein n=1 Tax=Polymorphum gilvum TaxID=991904 RepID=UPI00130535B0|nr:lysophospholipid acyltransferase family protein [Polymorphum gilvum]
MSPKPAALDDIPFDATRAPAPVPPPLSWLLSTDPWRRKTFVSHWLLDPLSGALSHLFHHALRLLPAAACSGFGATLAPLAQRRYAHRVFAKRIRSNMALLRPDLAADETALDAVLARWWTSVGRAYAEYSSVERMQAAGLIAIEGRSHLDAALASRRPLVCASVHVGCWEGLMATLPHALGRPVTGPFQPEPNRFTNALIHALRKRRGQHLFPAGVRSAGYLYRVLTSGAADGLFFVDEVRALQIHLPAFGRPLPETGNAVKLAKFARAADALILPVYLARTEGARFAMTFLPAFEPVSDAETVARLDAVFERVILDHIDQWYMLHELRPAKGPAITAPRRAAAPEAVG